ncbi:MAG: kinase/pyrophosphorylase [Burkholderiales bacterium]|nr:kinase/pyrophosphorylase [Burkholderiales bacterium]
MPNRSVFFVSDGTGITAETFGNSILAQFDAQPHRIRLPFVDTIEKAHQAVERINLATRNEGRPPVVFITLVNTEVLQVIRSCNGLVMDMFTTFVEPLEIAFGIKSNHRIGQFSDVAKSSRYNDRMDAINFALLHDDGQSSRNLALADVILVGVSRSGKTPTSLYLAMQHGVRAANYPLIPEDFARMRLPSALTQHRSKLFGLSIAPERLSEIRRERKPGSTYASLPNCMEEVAEAERLMRREDIRWLSSTHKSIEEIATTILQLIRPDRLEY